MKKIETKKEIIKNNLDMVNANNFIFWFNSQEKAYTLILYVGEKDVTKITVPESYNDGIHGERAVTQMAEASFKNLTHLGIIEIPSSIKEIASKLTFNCPKYIGAQLVLKHGEVPRYKNNAILKDSNIENDNPANNPNFVEVNLSKLELQKLFTSSPKEMSEINYKKFGTKLVLTKYDFAVITSKFPELANNAKIPTLRSSFELSPEK